MANCKNCKAEAPQALVCWVCACNRPQCLANFGLEDTFDSCWDVLLSVGAIYRHFADYCRIPDYALHGVLRVSICGISGMRDAMVVPTDSPRLSLCAIRFNPFYPLPAFKRRR